MEVLPARSPMPFTVHSICRAPASTAPRLFATARPRSLWQWTEKTARSAPGIRWRRSRINAAYSSGCVYPTVSGTLSVVAPASSAVVKTWTRKSGSERVASSAENSTSSQ
jgi:hypothetical protein